MEKLPCGSLLVSFDNPSERIVTLDWSLPSSSRTLFLFLFWGCSVRACWSPVCCTAQRERLSAAINKSSPPFLGFLFYSFFLPFLSPPPLYFPDRRSQAAYLFSVNSVSFFPPLRVLLYWCDYLICWLSLCFMIWFFIYTLICVTRLRLDPSVRMWRPSKWNPKWLSCATYVTRSIRNIWTQPASGSLTWKTKTPASEIRLRSSTSVER